MKHKCSREAGCSADIIEFKSAAPADCTFIRVDDAHRRFGDLYAAGRLPIRRAVFDAPACCMIKGEVERCEQKLVVTALNPLVTHIWEKVDERDVKNSSKVS